LRACALRNDCPTSAPIKATITTAKMEAPSIISTKVKPSSFIDT